jgi:hypothetical protein
MESTRIQFLLAELYRFLCFSCDIVKFRTRKKAYIFAGPEIGKDLIVKRFFLVKLLEADSHFERGMRTDLEGVVPSQGYTFRYQEIAMSKIKSHNRRQKEDGSNIIFGVTELNKR